jgi:hypothetical protein
MFDGRKCKHILDHPEEHYEIVLCSLDMSHLQFGFSLSLALAVCVVDSVDAVILLQYFVSFQFHGTSHRAASVFW